MYSCDGPRFTLDNKIQFEPPWRDPIWKQETHSSYCDMLGQKINTAGSTLARLQFQNNLKHPSVLQALDVYMAQISEGGRYL